jgi:hypothetical protein
MTQRGRNVVRFSPAPILDSVTPRAGFMQMESDICDLVSMKKLLLWAFEAPDNPGGLSRLAAEKLGEMIDTHKAQWYALHKSASNKSA